jgi:hypothetical protein
MKKTKLLLGIALIGLVGVFSACEEEETTEPTINITESSVPDSVEAGVEATLEFSVIADEKLEQIELRKGTKTLDTKTEGFTDKSADNYTYTGVLADTAEAESSLQMALIATDNKENTKTYDFEIYVKKIEGDPINEYTDKILGSYDANEGSSFASIDGTVYSWSDATNNSQKIDFIYFYGATNDATLAAPNDTDAESVFSGLSDWATQNATKFGTTELSAEDFDAVDDHLEIVDVATDLTETKINKLSVDDVIAFETASTSSHPSKKGLIKVNDITTGSDGTITIAVKVEQ